VISHERGKKDVIVTMTSGIYPWCNLKRVYMIKKYTFLYYIKW